MRACYNLLREKYYEDKDFAVKLAIVAGKFDSRNK
jgi:hypothetical protein